MRLGLLAVCIFQVLATEVTAQHLRFDHISTDQGLSQDIVTCITQDVDGFLWFGTEDGLNRYDGYGIQVFKFDPHDSASISNNWITALHVDAQGVLWVGTAAGLNRYSPHHENVTRVNVAENNRNELRQPRINSICHDSSGALFVASGETIYRISNDAAELVEVTSSNGLLDTRISFSTLYVDDTNTLWAGTSRGFYEVDVSTGSIIPCKKADARSSVSGSISDIALDTRGGIWIATLDSGLFRIDREQRTTTHYRNITGNHRSLRSDIVHSVCIDHLRNVWVGTFTGLERYDPQTDSFIHYEQDPSDLSSLLGNRIYDFYADRAGAIWIGTYRGGVNRFDPLKQRFLSYERWRRTDNRVGGGEVLCLAAEPSGTILIGTGSGVDRFDRRQESFDHIVDSRTLLRGSPASALFGRTDGSFWIGTESGDVFLVDSNGKELRRLPARRDIEGALGRRAIKSLRETDDGALWIGTSEAGLLKLDTKTWSLDTNPLSTTGQIFGKGVWVIHLDRGGRVWLGGWGGDAHLVAYDPKRGTIRQFLPDPGNPRSITGVAARTIFEDNSDIFWIGVWGGGLHRYDAARDSFFQITEHDGLSNNYVKGILGDDHGRLWISTERGLTRYDPLDGSFKCFTTEDGLQGNRFFSGSCSKARDGWMYFGGDNGFSCFHPDSIRYNDYLPPVVINRFRILDRPAVIGEGSDGIPVVHLDHNQDFFSFEFVALNFTQAHHNQYAYMLEGFEEDWIHSGTRRYAAYTHLGGGIYTFRVKASNNDGLWNKTGASVRVVIAPPYWRTWWFYGLTGLFLTFSLYTIYRYRLRRVVELERLRTRIASDLHDELASNLTSIAMFGKIILDDNDARTSLPERATQLLDRITVLSQESVTAIRDIIWAIDPRVETLDRVLQRMADVMIDECRAREITLNVRRPRPGTLPPTNLTPEQRKHLWLILKEAFRNALRHSEASAITLEATYKDSILKLSVSDNGLGIRGSGKNEGKGFGTMAMRARQLGGQLDVLPADPSGTTVVFSMRF